MSHFDELFPEKPYVKRVKKKKDNNLYLKLMVVALLITIIGYVVTVFYYSWHGKHVPDSLTYTFLPAILGQLVNTMLITRKSKDVEIAQIQSDCECNKNNGGV